MLSRGSNINVSDAISSGAKLISNCFSPESAYGVDGIEALNREMEMDGSPFLFFRHCDIIKTLSKSLSHEADKALEVRQAFFVIALILSIRQRQQPVHLTGPTFDLHHSPRPLAGFSQSGLIHLRLVSSLALRAAAPLQAVLCTHRQGN